MLSQWQIFEKDLQGKYQAFENSAGKKVHFEDLRGKTVCKLVLILVSVIEIEV